MCLRCEDQQLGEYTSFCSELEAGPTQQKEMVYWNFICCLGDDVSNEALNFKWY